MLGCAFIIHCIDDYNTIVDLKQNCGTHGLQDSGTSGTKQAHQRAPDGYRFSGGQLRILGTGAPAGTKARAPAGTRLAPVPRRPTANTRHRGTSSHLHTHTHTHTHVAHFRYTDVRSSFEFKSLAYRWYFQRNDGQVSASHLVGWFFQCQ